MRRAIGKPNKLEQAYQDAARSLGCIVCRWRSDHGMQREKAGQCGHTRVHHRNLGDLHGQKQIGQWAVVALGDWHHDGIPVMFWGDDEMRKVYGPSFKFAKDFRCWTADVLPDIQSRGTEAWQEVQDHYLREAGYGELVDALHAECREAA
ncbi:hypothetical protein ORG27_12300 [Stenotrophomonas lactitubi]|uniref:hypothetical protein n=1 Tax=Stenotrophomonas lactitubi TaxID=2045214 RepID=UPI00224999C3|nr:hypothetical protein [Stenotrophomonas lactitubi]MCX2894358.1 hypothetical protein [Stenotrophomonas lactitubi]